MKQFLWILIVTFSVSYTIHAQRALIDEWEANIGYLNMQGDFGQRDDFSSTFGNSGAMIGGKIYFNLLDSDRILCYACKHVKFDLSFNLGYSTLSFDKAYEKINSPYYDKVKALNGQFYYGSLAANVEYHVADFSNFRFYDDGLIYRLDPYFGLGFGVVFYDVNIESDLGNFETNPTILPSAFVGGIYDEPGIVPAINFEVGVRYLLNDELQLTFNNKWVYFISDKVDGLEPNPDLVKNKYNDWLFSPSVGLVIFIR